MIQSFVSGSILSNYLIILTVILLFISSISSLNDLLKGRYRFILSYADLLIVLFLISLLRTFFNGTLNFTAVLLYVIIIVLFSLIIRFDVQRNSFWNHFFGSFILILFINILLLTIGINDNFWNELGVSSLLRTPQKLRLLSYFDINVDRSGFFIFNNFAYYSMILSILLISVYFKIIKCSKFNSILIYFLGIISLLILDARGPTLILILVLVFTKIINLINKNNFFHCLYYYFSNANFILCCYALFRI